MKAIRKKLLTSSVRVLRKTYGISDFSNNEKVIISSNRAIVRIIGDEKDKKFFATPILMNRKEKREIIFTATTND